MRLFSLHDRTALVTGASQGLGKAMALALAEAGANVALIARNIAAAEKAAEEVRRFGTQAIAIRCDVSNEEEVNDASRVAIGHFGKIDILVNNAGINITKGVLEFSREDWNALLGVHLFGPYHFCRTICPHMMERRSGVIINHGSMVALSVLPDRAAYASAKAALIQFTKYLAVELAPFNIRANALCTGTMETEMVKKIIGEGGNFDYFTKRAPMGRVGQPHEIGGPTVFLASDASSFITGTTISVDGGYTAL